MPEHTAERADAMSISEYNRPKIHERKHLIALEILRNAHIYSVAKGFSTHSLQVKDYLIASSSTSL